MASKWAVANARLNCAPDPVPEGYAEADLEMIDQRPEIQGNSVRANVCDPTRQLVVQANRIRAPVLMVHPLEDRVVPLVYAENLRKVLVAAGVVVTMKTVPGGHVAHLAHAAEVNAAIRDWVFGIPAI